MARKGTLEIVIAGDSRPLERSLDKATGILSGFATGGATLLAGAGLAAGAGFVGAFTEVLDRQKLEDRLATRLGASAEEAERYGDIAGDLWANAYGENIEQVFEAIDAVVSSIGRDLNDGTLEELTTYALDFATAFETDVQQAVTAASVAINTGLAEDGTEAFDLLFTAAQQLPAEMRDELFPIVEEYSQFLSSLGFTGEEAFGLIVAAASEGRFEMDKVADALKELPLVAQGASDATVAAYNRIGLKIGEVNSALAEGGPAAQEVFGDIIEGLRNIEDPAERAKAAVDIFGVPIEDVGGIDSFLEQLDRGANLMDDVDGAAKRAGDSLNDNLSTRLTTLKNTAMQAFIDFVEDNFLDEIEAVTDAFSEDGLGGAVSVAADLLRAAQPEIEAWFNGTFLPFFEDTAIPAMAEIGSALGQALTDAFNQWFYDVTVGAAADWLNEELGQFEDSINRGLQNLGFEDPFNLGRIGGGSSGGSGAKPSSKPPRSPAPPPTNPSLSTLSSGGGMFGGGVQFHTGGEVRGTGLAWVADKERVLTEQQNSAFMRLVDTIDRNTRQVAMAGTGGRGAGGDIHIHGNVDREAVPELRGMLLGMSYDPPAGAI